MKIFQPILILIMIAAMLVAVFIVIPEKPDLPSRVPGNDNRPEKPAGREGGELLFEREVFTDLTALPVVKSENWPWFRGKNFDAIWHDDSYNIITDLSEPLECLWKVTLGEGYAGATVYEGIVYILDYDAKKQRDVLRALSLTDGKDIWNLSYNIKIKRDHGMSRSIPAVNEKYIVTIGPRCQVMCADRLTGEKLWHIDLVEKYQTVVPLWHASQCPLLDGDKAIIAPSGTSLMIAVDCTSGDILWETPNPDKWNMTHSSIMPITIEEQPMYVYCGDGGIAGINPENGDFLWKNYDWSMRTIVPSPVYLGNGDIFLCAGYNKGCALLNVYRTKNISSESIDNTVFTADMTYMKPAKVFGAVQHTPIYYKGYIYGIRQDKILLCMDPQGNIIWESPEKYGDSPFMAVNDTLVALDDHGTLGLVELTPDKYNLIARQQILFGRESWGLMAFVDGLLIARDFTEMRCIRLAVK